MENEIQLMNKDGQVLVSSRVVAQDFAKGHKDVLKSIRNLMAKNCAVKNMFFESNYISSRGREEIEYLMTRDGFSLLVMGFTGKEALQWKLKYIDAFNKMEQMIKNQIPQLSHEDEAILKVIKSNSQEERMMALIEYKNVITKPLTDKIEQDAPKVEAYEQYMDSNGLYTVTNVAKYLNIKRDDLYKWLRDKELVYKQKRVCTVKAENLGIMEMKIKNGYECLLVTPKGIEYIRNKLEKEDE